MVLLGILVTSLSTACATAPPQPGGVSFTPTTSASVSPSASHSESAPVSPTPTPSASATPAPSQSPAAAAITLGGKGLGGFDFGASQAEVEKSLQAVLGKPDDVYNGVACELDSKSPFQSTSSYGGLSVMYTAKDRSRKSPRTLSTWTFNLSKKLTSPLALDENVPLNLTFKQLKSKYPKGKLEDTGLGEDSYIFTLPSKLRFIGEGSPDMVQAGRVFFCE
jgi:hypothetical protein